MPGWVRAIAVAYWTLLFGVLPLAMNYPSFFSIHLASVPGDALVSIPKAVVLAACWVGGILFAFTLAPDTHLKAALNLVRGRSAWMWSLVALIGWIVLSASLVDKQLLSPWLGSRVRYDGVVFQVMWWSLIPITYSIARATSSLGKRVVLAPATVAAVLIAFWTTLESYGFEPLSLLSAQVSASSNGNAAASLGHQALVSIYLSFLAMVWSVLFVGRCASFKRGDGGARTLGAISVITVLWMGAFGSGGRSGVYAAVGMWVVFVVWTLARRGGRSGTFRRVAAISSVIVLTGLSIGFTNHHVQAKTSATVTGGKSFAHRLITWQVGTRAVGQRPWIGYGPDAFAYEIWKFASDSQARELLTEAVPRQYLASAKRVGEGVVYVDGNRKIHMFRLNYDKTHNYLIELAFASGLPAALAFLALVISGGLRLARSRDPFARAIVWGFLVFFIAVQAWFYTLPLDPLIWGWFGVGLGWASAVSAAPDADAGGDRGDRQWLAASS